MRTPATYGFHDRSNDNLQTRHPVEKSKATHATKVTHTAGDNVVAKTVSVGPLTIQKTGADQADLNKASLDVEVKPLEPFEFISEYSPESKANVSPPSGEVENQSVSPSETSQPKSLPPLEENASSQEEQDNSKILDLFSRINTAGSHVMSFIYPDAIDNITSEFQNALDPGKKNTKDIKETLEEIQNIKEKLTTNDNLTISDRKALFIRLIECKEQLAALVYEESPQSQLYQILNQAKQVDGLITTIYKTSEERLPSLINSFANNVHHIRGLASGAVAIHEFQTLVEAVGPELTSTIVLLAVIAAEKKIEETQKELEALQAELAEKTAMTALLTTLIGSSSEKEAMFEAGPDSSRTYPKLAKQDNYDQTRTVFQENLEEIAAYGWGSILEKALDDPSAMRMEIQERNVAIEAHLTTVRQEMTACFNTVEQLEQEVANSHDAAERDSLISKIESEVLKIQTLLTRISDVYPERRRLTEASVQLTQTAAERVASEEDRKGGLINQEQFADLFINAQLRASGVMQAEFLALRSAYEGLDPVQQIKLKSNLYRIQALQQDSLVRSIQYKAGKLLTQVVGLKKEQAAAGITGVKAVAALSAAAHITAAAKAAALAATTLSNPFVATPMLIAGAALSTHILLFELAEKRRLNSDFEQNKPSAIQESFEQLSEILEKSSASPDHISQSKDAISKMLHPG